MGVNAHTLAEKNLVLRLCQQKTLRIFCGSDQCALQYPQSVAFRYKMGDNWNKFPLARARLCRKELQFHCRKRKQFGPCILLDVYLFS